MMVAVTNVSRNGEKAELESDRIRAVVINGAELIAQNSNRCRKDNLPEIEATPVFHTIQKGRTAANPFLVVIVPIIDITDDDVRVFGDAGTETGIDSISHVIAVCSQR